MRRWAGPVAGIASLWLGMLGGCTQLLGIAEISAGQDGPVDAMSGSDGPLSDGGDANACINDLSYAYGGGFNISFTMKTRQPDGVIALLNQREQCTLGTFWDLQLVTQALYFEMADLVMGDASVTSKGVQLNDDLPHDIVITRDRAGLVQLKIDGKLAGMATMRQSLGTKLPTMRIGTSVCVGEDPNVQFHGTLSNVCVNLQ